MREVSGCEWPKKHADSPEKDMRYRSMVACAKGPPASVPTISHRLSQPHLYCQQSLVPLTRHPCPEWSESDVPPYVMCASAMLARPCSSS